MWRSLYEQCEIPETSTPGYTFVPKPKNDTLCRFEVEHAIKLPKSFREYALIFGAGQLAGTYTIATPLEFIDQIELWKFNIDRHGRKEERLWEQYCSSEEIDQFLFFCSDDGILYAWKMDDITECKGIEYAVFEFARFPGIRRVAKTFEDFVLNVIFSADTSGYTPGKTFQPTQVPEE